MSFPRKGSSGLSSSPLSGILKGHSLTLLPCRAQVSPQVVAMQLTRFWVSRADPNNRRKKVIFALCLLSAKKPFPASLRSQPPTSHWLGLGHMPYAKPVIG